MMRRPLRRSTLPRRGARLAAAGLCTLAAACTDDLPVAPADVAPSAALGGSLEGLDDIVRAAFGNSVFNRRELIGDVTDFGGSAGISQVAALSRQIAGFPTEGSHYLVISSGNAAEPDAKAASSTMFGADAANPSRWDRGGLEVTMQMPAGARWLAMDVRYFSWDAPPHLDPVRITATYEDTIDGVTTEKTVVLREYTTATELLEGGAPTYGKLSLGRLRSEEFDARKFRNKTVVLRFEAADDGYGYDDSGLFVDNVRVVNAKFDDWKGPITHGTTINPGPVPANTLFRVVSQIVDRGPSVARIRSAEYSIDDGAWTPMLVGGRTDSSATARWVFEEGLPEPGVYTICVRGLDAKGNSGQPECVDQAIYDPSEGTFLTGSGWAYANHGSDPLNWDVAGRVTFSVSAGYRPRVVDPTKPPRLRGDASFFFADDETGMTLRFVSTELSYVTVGPSAMFENIPGYQSETVGRVVGKGRLFRNDELVRGTRSPLHSFLISAVDVDGKLRPAGDRLRIKVWDTVSGAVVLDTQLGETNREDAFALRDAAVPFTWTEAGGVLLKHTVPPPSAP